MPTEPFVGLEHVEAQTGRLLATVPSGTMSSSAARFFAGDVLYGRMRPYLNKVVRPEFNGLASAEFIVFPAIEGIDNGFIRRRLAAHDFVGFSCSQYEGDRPRVKFEQLGKFRVSLPPAAEQRRIVAKLEELLSDLDAGVAELKAAQKKLAQYRQSLLKAAVEGALTADWRAQNTPTETGAQLLERILTERRARWEARQRAKFKEQGKAPPTDWQKKYPEPVQPDTTDLPELPEGWVWASVDQLSFVVRGASPRPAGDPRFFGGRIPWITVGSLTADGSMYLKSVSQFVTEAGRDASRFVEAGTLLLTNSGATLGVPKITSIGGCINDGSVALLDIDEPLKVYLYWYLRTQTAALRAMNQGAAQPNLNTDIVRRICVPICALVEMDQVNHLLGSEVDPIEEQRKSIAVSLKQSTAQRQNILRAAFAGQLVPQDPSDEPASVLLERIRAERAGRAAVKKPRSGRVKATA
jgi:type I restriction enzyme, S subunit